MIGAVIIMNLAISFICLYLAAKVWKIGKKIDKVTNKILKADRRSYNVLHNAPGAIAKGEKVSRNLRQQYQKLQRQMQTIRQLLLVLTFLGKFTGRGGRKLHS